MNAIATTLIRLGTVSSLVLLALPVMTGESLAEPVSVNWDALGHAAQANTPIVLNPASAGTPSPAVPPKTKTFKLTAPKLLNPKTNPKLANTPPKARPSKKLEDMLESESAATRVTTKREASEVKQPSKRAAKKAEVTTKPNLPSVPARTVAPKAQTAVAAPVPKAPAVSTKAKTAAKTKAPVQAVAAPKATAKKATRAAPTKRIPTKLPTAQTAPKKAKTPGNHFADIMQENLALLPTPAAQTGTQWGSEPTNKTLPATHAEKFSVATFGAPKTAPVPPSAPIRKATKPTEPAATIITTGTTKPRKTVANAIEETARELAAIEDAPQYTQMLRSPEPAEGRIVFNAGSTQLMSSGRSTLAALAKKLNLSAARIQLKAYSSQSTLTTASDQRRLSLKRAMAVRKHLTTEFGISSSRIDVRVLGTVKDSGPGDRVDIVMTSS